MANRQTQLYHESVVKDSLKRGGASITTTTSLKMRYVDEPKP
jgi:hypothetical protein